MARCDTCGNEYEHSFTWQRGSEIHVFDSFECAIHLVAPTCAHCGCRVLGHGAEVDGRVYCCAHCAREHAGVTEVRDSVTTS